MAIRISNSPSIIEEHYLPFFQTAKPFFFFHENNNQISYEMLEIYFDLEVSNYTHTHTQKRAKSLILQTARKLRWPCHLKWKVSVKTTIASRDVCFTLKPNIWMLEKILKNLPRMIPLIKDTPPSLLYHPYQHIMKFMMDKMSKDNWGAVPKLHFYPDCSFGRSPQNTPPTEKKHPWL
jgi:hypothetical protein